MPDQDYKRGGWRPPYIIHKADGSDVDPEAIYFVLRLDADPHARAAAFAYALSVQDDNLQLACDLRDKIYEGVDADRQRRSRPAADD